MSIADIANTDKDALLRFISEKGHIPDFLSHVVHDIMTKGYSVVPSVLTPEECQFSVKLLWDFVEEVSGNIIKRNDPDPRNWYPKSELRCIENNYIGSNSAVQEDCHHEDDPWPHTGAERLPNVFHSLGARFLLGHSNGLVAERVFQPLLGEELHCRSEGFTFTRPSIVPSSDSSSNQFSPQWRWVRRNAAKQNETNKKSQGEHYNQPHFLKGLHTIQACVAFTDQSEDKQDGHFLCWPYSHSEIHQLFTAERTYQNCFSAPLTDEELYQLESLDVQSCIQDYLDHHRLHFDSSCPKASRSTHVYVKAGDVILWRSDLLHAIAPPGPTCTHFTATSYCIMQPACWTPNDPHVVPEKVQAYKWGMTEDQLALAKQCNRHHRRTENNSEFLTKRRPFYRFGPPQVSIQLAKLYGLIPYHSLDLTEEIKRAVIRGVRFIDNVDTEYDVSFPSSTSVLHQIHPPRCKVICDVVMQRLIMNDGTLLYGQEKYLGGMCSPCGNYIYGCPGHAHRVLRVSTKTNQMDFIGPSFPGKYKWLRGVEIPACVMANKDEFPFGCCLALPSNAKCILKINPKTSEVTTFGEISEECGWLYHGGNLLLDGFVYAIPANASRVLKIDPRENKIEFLGPAFPGKQKWYGGIVGCDGCLYGIPQNFSGVLKIDPRDQSCSILHSDSITEGDWKWHGGLSIQDGRYIVGFPSNADSILMIDVIEQKVFTVHSPVVRSGRHRIPQDGRYKYLGGAVSEDGRYTYFFPCDAERVLRMDNKSFQLTLIGPLLLEGENKFQNGFLGNDGCLYGIPQRACGILRIIPASTIQHESDDSRIVDERLVEDHVDIMYCGDEMVTIKDKFEGGVMDLDGSIYCIPMQAKALIKITPRLKTKT